MLATTGLVGYSPLRMIGTSKALFVFACFSAVGAWVTAARAADSCKTLPYTLDSKSTDATIKAWANVEKDFAGWLCGDKTEKDFDNKALYYRKRFGIHKDEGWGRDNYGWDKPCDATMPLGRTLSAFYLIENSYTPKLKDWNARSYIPVQDMYGFVAGGYNELDDLRAGKCADDTFASTQEMTFGDYIIVYQNAFERNIIFRASTLIHENWHNRTASFKHTCDAGDQNYYIDLNIPVGCQANGVCAGSTPNPNPKVKSTFAAQGTWAMSYHASANLNTSTTTKSYALKLAKTLLHDRICDQSSIPKGISDYLATAK